MKINKSIFNCVKISNWRFKLIRLFVLIVISYFNTNFIFGQTTVTIGSGTSASHYPLNDYYIYSRSQCLYLSSEIGTGGTITKLRWYRNDTGDDAVAIGTTEIWLYETANSVLTGADWEGPGTLVATISDIDLGSGDEWYEIDITDFIYSGTKNLLISIRTQNAPYTVPHSNWRHTSTTNMSRLGQSDGTNPPSMLLNDNRPNIQLDLEALPTFMPPTGLSSTNILASSATINWTASTSNPSGGYDIYYSTSSIAPTAGTTPSASVSAGITTYNMSSLSAYNTYYFWVRSDCGSGDYSSWAGSSTFYTGCCVPTGSTEKYLTNVVTIGGVTNISNSTTTSTGGYGDYTATNSCSNYIGVSTSIALTPNAFTHYFYCWIDWNSDLDFEDVNETIFATTSYESNYIGSINIPTGTSDGSYTMRVANSYSGSITACGPAASGEYEDYIFKVVSVPSCYAPSGLGISNVTDNSATMSWTAPSSVPSQGYKYYYSTSSTEPTTETSGSTAAGITTANLSGLADGSFYYYWVRSNCGGGDYSVWLGPQEFTTPLSGTYTINKAQATGGTNFNSFSDLASIANAGGVYSSTIINVVEGSGPYEEQVFLYEIPNISETQTLTINGNGDTLKYSSSNTNERATLKLSGTEYTTFNDLIVKSQGDYGFTVQLMNEADFNTFDNCEFYADTTSTSSAYAAFIASNDVTDIDSPGGLSASNLTVSNCKIIGGFVGIALNGPSSLSKLSCPQNNQILNNEITNFYTTGIYIRNYQKDLIISGNSLSRPCRTTISTSNQLKNSAGLCAIAMPYGSINCEITKNQIYDLIASGSTSSSSTTTKGIYVNEINDGLLISNNLIYGFDGVEGVIYGIDMKSEAGEFSKIYHNTVSLDNTTHCNAKVIYCFSRYGEGTSDIKNNIFSCTTNSTADKVIMYFWGGPATINSNNNILYIGTTDIESYTSELSNVDYASLADWQCVNSSTYDQNSMDCNPAFVAPLLTPFNVELSDMGIDLTAIVEDDIFGYQRPVSPTPGAIEMNPIVLPIVLKSFNATCQNQYINIYWSTVSEINNDYFILEKSNGKDEFFEVARVHGAGNSNEIQNYNYIDESLFVGDNYYRLKQIDIDGRVTIYNVIDLNCDNKIDIEPEMYVYPNPFRDEINVIIDNMQEGDFVLEIFDDLSRIVYSKKCTSNGSQYRTILELDGLRPAVYNLRSRSDESLLNVRVIKK